jgi:hypothetical protein
MMPLRQLRGGQDVGRSIPQDAGRDLERAASEAFILAMALDLEVGAGRQQFEPGTRVDFCQPCEAAVLALPAGQGGPQGAYPRRRRLCDERCQPVCIDPGGMNSVPGDEDGKDTQVVSLHAFDRREEEGVLDVRVGIGATGEVHTDAHHGGREFIRL